MSVSKHKEWVRDIYDKCASDYGNGASSFFNDFGKAFVLRSKVEPGMRVLDVACGKGAVLFPLAEVVGKEGEVIGIDLSANMISEIKKDSRLTPMPWVKVKKMDAEKNGFPKQFI